MTRRLVAMAPLLALAVALVWVDLPLFTVAPGSAREVLPLIDVEGSPTHAPRGRYLLTTVSVGRATVFEALAAWLDRDTEVVREDEVVPEGETEREYEERTRSSMDESKIAAAVVALGRTTDYPRRHGPGALVQYVDPGSPAGGVLYPGDVIVSVNGRRLSDLDDLTRTVRRAGTRRDIVLGIETDGEPATVKLRPGRIEGIRRPVIGIVIVENFPFDVRISSDAVGGPSAGLMWALGLIDLLDEEDRTDGRVVAGTGEIDLEGGVHPIGGVEHKVVAAERAGAEIFLVPRENYDAARAVAGRLRVVSVGSVDEAIRALERTVT